jgi:hypothetical protein
VCYEHPEKYIAEELLPVMILGGTGLSTMQPYRRFTCSEGHQNGTKSVSLLKMLVSKQSLNSVIGRMLTAD